MKSESDDSAQSPTYSLPAFIAGATQEWVNPKMKRCPYVEQGKCGFYSVDQNEIDEHVLDVHVRGQMVLSGRAQTLEDRKIALLAQSPNDEVECPFCFTKQRLRATREFLAGYDPPQLSKMHRCCGCKKRMRRDSLDQTKFGPFEFGKWVGTYPRFWGFVDHDVWTKALKKRFPNLAVYPWNDPNQPLNLFWKGYSEVRPEFARKQEIKKAMRDYQETTGFKDEDIEDESGR